MAVSRGYFRGKIPETQIFRGQAKLIIDALATATTPQTAKSTAVIAKDITAALQTRQDPERVVAFYMSIWKRKGWIRQTDLIAPADEAARSAAAESAPHSVQDEVGGIHADEHVAAQMEAAVEATPVLPDLRGRKLSDAVVEVIKFVGKPLTPQEATDVFHEHGYEFTIAQVTKACAKLAQIGIAQLTADGTYELQPLEV